MTLRDYGSSWCTYNVHMVMEIKEYDIRAHGYSIVALVRGHEIEVWI